MKVLPFERQQLDAVLFDLDGTLIDTDDGMVMRLDKFIRRYAFFLHTGTNGWARKIVMFSETPSNKLLTLLGKITIDKAVLSWWRPKPGDDDGMFSVMPGTAEMLRALKSSYRLGIVTSRDRGTAEALLEKEQLSRYFDAMVTAESTSRLKPYPEPLLKAAELLHTEPGRCLMVGDTTMDILAGIRAGAWTAGVLCGFGEREELKKTGAHILLDTAAQLPSYLLPR